MGINACLCGGGEHRRLTFTMLTQGDNCWTYVESDSKNRPASLTIARKQVTIYASPEEGDRCPVRILDKYMEFVPLPAIEANKCFNLKPLPATEGDIRKPWFANQTVGRHTLANMVKVCCEEAGLQGMTNHSLRATSVTKMFAAGVPEKVIQERMVH